MRRLVFIWGGVLVLHGMCQAAFIWAEGKKQTSSTTYTSSDGGSTTVYGPQPTRSSDGGIYVIR